MNALISRLQFYAALAEADFSALWKLAHRIVVKQPGQAIVSAGERLGDVFVVEKGWAIRYRILEDGSRQIVNFMLPGDCFDLQAVVSAQSDHHVSALTQVTLRSVTSSQFIVAMQSSATLATAFWWAAVQEESILREHIVRLGRRTARQRCAHLLVELHRRLTMGGAIAPEEREILPLTREVMADTLGLSPVHVSRSIAHLRNRKLIDTTRGAIRLRDVAGLADIGEFSARYLHVQDRRLLALPVTGAETA